LDIVYIVSKLSYKKILLISILIPIFIYTEEFFSALIGIFILLVIVILLIEFLLDIYLVMIFIIDHFRK